nr:uncharacterized protein LOC105868404 [Microcebus murinus]
MPDRTSPSQQAHEEALLFCPFYRWRALKNLPRGFRRNLCRAHKLLEPRFSPPHHGLGIRGPVQLLRLDLSAVPRGRDGPKEHTGLGAGPPAVFRKAEAVTLQRRRTLPGRVHPACRDCPETTSLVDSDPHFGAVDTEGTKTGDNSCLRGWDRTFQPDGREIGTQLQLAGGLLAVAGDLLLSTCFLSAPPLPDSTVRMTALFGHCVAGQDLEVCLNPGRDRAIRVQRAGV